MLINICKESELLDVINFVNIGGRISYIRTVILMIIFNMLGFEIFKRNIKALYHGHWGERPKVIWVNNDILNINGRDKNTHTSEKWENKK